MRMWQCLAPNGSSTKGARWKQQLQVMVRATVLVVMMSAVVGCATAQRSDAAMPEGPSPALAWMFNSGSTTDAVRGIRGTFTGGAHLANDGIYLPGNGSAFFQTERISFSAGVGKTLEVLVKLDNLEQQAGGAMSIQSGDGNVYDGIVYSESARGLWEPGSDLARRGPDVFDFSRETEADKAFVHIAITHSADGFITVYRNGRVHLPRYKTGDGTVYDADDARFTFGARHVILEEDGRTIIAGQLMGTVACARFYTHELSHKQVATAFSARCNRVNPFEAMPPASFEGLLQEGTSVRSWTNASTPSQFGNWAPYRPTPATSPVPALVSSPLFAQGTTAISLRHNCSAHGIGGIEMGIRLQPGRQYSVSFLATAADDVSTTAFPFGIVNAASFAEVFRPTGRAVDGRAGWQQFRFHFTADDHTDNSETSGNSTGGIIFLRLLAPQHQCILVDNVRLVQVFPRDSLALDPGFEQAAVELGVSPFRLDGTDASDAAKRGQALSHWVVSPVSGSDTAVLRRSLPPLTSSWALSLHGQVCTSSQYDEVYQVVPTTPGATYRLSLSIRNKAFADGQSDRSATALLSFGSVRNRKFFTRGRGYTTYTVTATAAAASTRLRVAAAAADCILVDDVSVVLQTAAPASLLTNGGFEHPRVFLSGAAALTNVPAEGWTASGGSGSIVTVTNSGSSASGVQSYRMKTDCSNAASLAQVVATVPGLHYRLSFAARAAPHNTEAQGAKVHTGIVEFAGLSDTFQVSGETALHEDGNHQQDADNRGWAQFSFDVAADEARSSLTFRAGPDQCFELDAVSVRGIPTRNLTLPEAAGYPDFVSTDNTVPYSELEEACEALGGRPAVLTNDADLEAATASCPSLCYVGYDRAGADGWHWHHGDEDSVYAPWAQGQQPSAQDVTSGVEEGTSGLVPLGDGSSTYFGLCVVYRDYSAWAGLWSITLDSETFTVDISAAGDVHACHNTTTDAADTDKDNDGGGGGEGGGGEGDGSSQIECTRARVSLVRVDGYNDFYRIERTDGKQDNEERIELLLPDGELRLQRFNATTGHFVDDAIGRRLKTCPTTIQGLTQHATASCPPFVLPGSTNETCTAMCGSGFVEREGTSPTFICNADGEWEGDLKCDGTFQPIRDVRVPFATSAETPFENAVDGDTSTFWQSRHNLFHSSLFFDLNREETVRRVQIYTRLSADEGVDDNAIPEFVHIDTAADIRYPFDTRVATMDLQPTTGWQTFDVAVRARFLRFHFTTARNNAFVRLHEAVFETADDGRNITIVTPDPSPVLEDIRYCDKRHHAGNSSIGGGGGESEEEGQQRGLPVRDQVTEGLEMLFTFDDEDCPFEERVSSQLARVVGNAQRTTTAKIGTHAAAFDGRSGLVLDRPDVYATSYALSAWIRLSALPTSTQMIAGDWITSAEDADTLQFLSAQVQPGYLTEMAAAVQLFAVEWEADRWYHVVSQRGSSEQSLWLDGQRLGVNSPGVQVPGPRDAFWIGTRGSQSSGGLDGSGWFFEGAIDDVRLYNRTLSSREINAIYQAAFCAPGAFFSRDDGCQGVSECKPGTVQTPPTPTSDRVCEPCPAGSLPGNSSCAECGPGVFVPAGKTGACADYSCPPGTADKDQDPSTPCDVCNSTSEHQPRPTQTSCIPHTVCGPGEEPDAAKPANALRDTNCKACMPDTFKPSEGNVECAPASTCPAGTAIVTDVTPTTNRVCGDCVQGQSFTDRANEMQCEDVSSCVDGTQETQAPTVTADRACKPCSNGTFSNQQTAYQCHECTSTCGGGHYLINPCTDDQVGRQYDAVCDRCSQGTFREEHDDPTTCREVTRCEGGEYEETTATSTTDAVCKGCTTCRPGQFIHSPCRGRRDTECRNCTCADGFYLVEPCDPSSTRAPACRPCSAECATCSGPEGCDTCAGSLQKRPDGTCDDDCEMGKYRSRSTGMCEPCADSCSSCFGSDNGDCTSCDQGLLLHGGKCVEGCDALTRAANGSCVRCDECDEGFYLKQCTGNATQDCAAVTSCVTGSKFQIAAPTPTSDTKCDTCRPCVPGTYRVPGSCAGDTDSICLGCDGLTSYTDEANLPRCKAMTLCPAGTETAGASPTSDRTCKGCAAGATDHDFQPRTKCRSCGAGSYTPANSTGPCSQHICPAGSVDDDSNPATPCVSCSDLGSTGLYQPRAGRTSCMQTQPCPKGTRELVSGTATAPPVCVACTQGFNFQDEEGQTECKRVTSCDDGYYETAGPTRTSDRECEDANPCKDTNQYLLRPGTPTSEPVCDFFTVCTRNLEFEASPPTPTSDRRCERVAFCGEFEREIIDPTPTSDRVCLPLPSCPPGEGLKRREDTACITCPAGKFSADRSATLCQDCPQNTFNPDEGQISCRAATACGERQMATTAPTPTSDRVCEFLVEMTLVGRLNVVKVGDMSEADDVIAKVTAVVNSEGPKHNVDPATINIRIGPLFRARFITPSEANAHQLRVWANSGTFSIVHRDKHYTLRLAGSGDPYVPPAATGTTTGPETTSTAVLCQPGKEPEDGAACVPCRPGTYNNQVSRAACQPCPDNTFASDHGTVTCTRVAMCTSDQYERASPTSTSDRECASGIGTRLYIRPELTLFRAGPRDVPALRPAVVEQVVGPNAQKNGYPASSISIRVTRDDSRHVTVGFDSLSRGDLNAFSSVFRRGFVDFKLRGHNIRMALIGFNVTLPVATTTTATTVEPQVTTEPGKSAGSSSSGINNDTLTALIVVVVVVIVLVAVGAVYVFKRSRSQSANVTSPYHSSFVNPVYERSPPAGNTEFFDPGDASDDPADYTDVTSLEGKDVSYMMEEA